MGKIPKITCPICGMNVYLRNLDRHHEVQSYIVHFVKGFRGKIIYEKAETTGDSLYDFWINHLEGVIVWLKQEKLKLRIKSLTLEPTLRALVLSVSSPMVASKLSYPKGLTLNVQEGQLIRS